MPWKPRVHRPAHMGDPKERQRQYDKARGSGRKRLYNRRWERARKVFLEANPLCVRCAAEGNTTLAEVVDHKTPHRMNYKLFWDQDNWQALCKSHHDRKTATEDRKGGGTDDPSGLLS